MFSGVFNPFRFFYNLYNLALQLSGYWCFLLLWRISYRMMPCFCSGLSGGNLYIDCPLWIYNTSCLWLPTVPWTFQVSVSHNTGILYGPLHDHGVCILCNMVSVFNLIIRLSAFYAVSKLQQKSGNRKQKWSHFLNCSWLHYMRFKYLYLFFQYLE